MRSAGGRSWRFKHWADQFAHALLRVRDGLRLPVSLGPGVPPPLIEVPPDRSDLLDASLRVRAAQHWTHWWMMLVEFECRQRFRDGEDARTIHERTLEYRRAIHPETADALVGSPLRGPALMLFGEASDWAGTSAVRIQEDDQIFAWRIVRKAAEATARAAGVDVQAITGAASVLAVEGEWWNLAAPGLVLCSLTAATDPAVTAVVLQTVFESGLNAQ